ncbi:zinc finger protein 761-like isoform X2 [Aricia agestis]|uniref:zinc finger protein 761-like isoform X2 n=1 Tax=Aricia agestis TaxID=91739 RepID=UPI001C203F4D|nr:zinc finger protein 761-like isoform X2 [Aricia agestis]
MENMDNVESNVEFLDDENTCSICFAEFLDTSDLSQHIIQIHLNEATLNRYCCVCRNFFKDVEEFALHLRTYHIKSLRWCKYCTRVFFNKEDLRRHEKKHGEWKYKSCSHCDKTFLFKDILAAHEYKNHRIYRDPSEGIMLQECFPILSSLLHMNIKKFFTVEYTHESYKCVSCGLTTSDIDKFLQHVEAKSKRPFACDKCCQLFCHKYRLNNHLNGKCNKSIEWSECGICEKRIESGTSENHAKQCHKKAFKKETTPKSIPIINCKLCKKMFVGNVALNKHIDRTHKPNFHLYKYKCVSCDIPFYHPKYLFAHYYTYHRDLQPYTCKICDKKYRVRKSFTLHIKLDHKSVGFVEFDKDYQVFFTDKKSENPFQPYNILSEYLEENQIVDIKGTENSKIYSTVENSDFINVTETECETDIDNSDKIPSLSLDIETECETDVEGNKTNPAVTPQTYIEIELDCESNAYKSNTKAISKRRRSIKEESETDVDKTTKKGKSKKRSRALKARNKRKQNYNTEVSSNDSDVPLIEMTKRDVHLLVKRRGKKKFVCIKCNKNCYTYQNYNHHMSLHVGFKLKKCIKCQKTFKSRMALDEHMKKKHTSSKLTETLKQVLERRKNAVQGTPNPVALRENFRKTIHKVDIPEDDSAPAVLTLIEDDLSAKSFIESFMPEDSSKEIKVTNSITIKETRGGYRSPLIKMTRFKPESPIKSTKLQMPVKFKPENVSHVKATIKVVHKPVHKPEMALSQFSVENNDTYYNAYDSDNVLVDERDEIPEVAEEIMLNTEEKDDVKENKNIIDAQNSIVIPNFHNYGDIKIAHLQSEAPFYKIISMKDIMKSAPNKPPQGQPPEESSEPVTLPGGIKLVSVNPLAHLLGTKDVEKLFKPNKHYVPKVNDIKSAMEKAMNNVYKPKRRQKIS